MPIHDWTSVEACIFHAFHHGWISEIAHALNRGLPPSTHYALPERVGWFELPSGHHPEASQYAAKAKAVVVRHVSDHRVVAIVEIVSPGNKSSESDLSTLVRKAREVLAAGGHLLIVDLFPPGPRDPDGIHRAVWGDDCGADFHLPDGQPLTCVAYIAGATAEALVEPVASGDVLPEMPLFITPEVYVPVPLEATYEAAWEGMPAYWRGVLTTARE
jgi:hypothetical protein